MEGKIIPIGERSIDTQKLIDTLRAVPVGDVCPYEVLSAAIGRSVTGSARGNLGSARNTLEREERIVFGTVRSVGVKRLDDEGKVKQGMSAIPSLARKARKADRTLASVEDFASMSAEARLTHNVGRTVLAVVRRTTGAPGRKRLAEAVERSSEALPLGRTMEVLGK